MSEALGFVGGGSSPACSWRSAAASTSLAATFGSVVARAIFSSAAAAWRVWNLFFGMTDTSVARERDFFTPSPFHNTPRGEGSRLLRWRGGRHSVEELGDGSNKLRWREWLGEHDTVGDTLRGPFVGVRAAHVHDGKSRIDFPYLRSNLPAVQPPLEGNVGNEGLVFLEAA